MAAPMSEATPPTSVLPDPIDAARAALDRHAWVEAYDQFALADGQGALGGRDLEGFAQASFFAAHPETEVTAKERAFKAYETEGDAQRAAYLAFDVAREYTYVGKLAIASAWIRRAERLVGSSGETYVHGYLSLLRSEMAAATGDLEGALTLADQAIEIGERAADPDLKAFAMINLGSLKIASGATSDGVAMMEEASFAAVNGELSPFTTGVTACRMISACRDLTDYRRASEWIEATERYCDQQSLAGFPGVCRVHRAEVAAVTGAWDSAEQELARATVELGRFNATPPQADGFYAIGDIRRLKGDFEGAESALRDAHERGRSPQPALALIRLAEGKVKAASVAIEAAVAEAQWDRWAWARLIPAQVEIAVAAGDLVLARTAVGRMAEIVSGYPSPAMEASRQVALARVLLAEGDAAGAAHELRGAVKGWREVGSPYEVARSRALLAHALRITGNDDDADLELRSASEAFQRLGARVDLEAAERDARDAEDRRSGPQTTRKTFMFTDIVGSTNLAEALGDQAWERLLRWHDDVLRGLVVGGGGEIVNSTGDGFFAAFESARAGIDSAISIQRALIEHRDTTGFALSVRIGLHTADANRRGADYSGKAVHVAARVGALAQGGEILATSETLAEAGDPPSSDARAAQVRGVSEPVDLAAVVWS
jgi:class 3 adenylate cyclase